MASVFGENGLCYINAVALPLANEWSIDIEQELIEAPKSFVCPADASSKWTDRTGGFFSGSGSVSCLYDASDVSHIDYVLADAAYEILLYPYCEVATKYWKGSGWTSLSMADPVDGYVTVDYNWTSTGAWVFASA